MSQVILAEQFGHQLQGYLGDLSDNKILKCDDYTASMVTSHLCLPDRNFESQKQRLLASEPISSPLKDLPQHSWAAALCTFTFSEAHQPEAVHPVHQVLTWCLCRAGAFINCSVRDFGNGFILQGFFLCPLLPFSGPIHPSLTTINKVSLPPAVKPGFTVCF